MESEISQASNQSILEDVRDALRDQTTAFSALSGSIQDLISKLDVYSTGMQMDRDKVHSNPERRLMTDEEQVMEDARTAQIAFGEFDPQDIYHTLVDPHQRSRQERMEYAKQAAKIYASGDCQDVQAVFEEDFFYWSASYFKELPTAVISNIRNTLINEGVPIGKRAGLRMSTALADYVTTIRKKATLEENLQAGTKTERDVHNANEPLDYTVEPSREIRNTSVEEFKPRIGSNARPGDVSKLFGNDFRYSGGPTEPIRRRFDIFLNACHLCGVNTSQKETMFPLLQTTFLRGPALIHFMDVVIFKAEDPHEAIQMLECHFLDERAKRVNDDVWMELSFELVKSSRAAMNREITFEKVLNDLYAQISELADIRTGSGHSADVMAKLIAAVRNVEPFSLVCRNPPRQLQALISALRSCALEADRAALKGPSEHVGQPSGSTGHSAFTATAESLFESFLVDRRLRMRDNEERTRRAFKGYGDIHQNPNPNPRRGQGSRDVKRVPWDVCIICNRKGCHSSVHRKAGNSMYRKFAKAYLAGQNMPECSDDESDDSDGSLEENIEPESQAYIVFTRATAAMGMSPKKTQWVVDGALIDTGSNVISSVGLPLLPSARIVNMRNTEPVLGNNPKRLGGIGSVVSTLGTYLFYFHFGGREYSVNLNVVPGPTPLIISHKDLDGMGLNYQTYYKTIDRPEDGYKEKVEMRNYLPFLLFPKYGYLSAAQLQNIHRNLGHPSIEKQMQIIETADLDDVPANTRKELIEIVKYCRACQLKQGKPRRFLFSIRDPIVGEFNHIIQIDVVNLVHGNVLHIIDVGTRFQNGGFITKMDAECAWRSLRKFWIDVYAGAPDYVHTDAGTNFNSAEFMNKVEALGTIIRIAPTEGHDRIGIVERSHAYLKTVYSKLCIDLPDVSREDRLSMSFRAINDSPCSDTGVSPTTLVFGVYPKIPGGGARGSMMQRANVIRACTEMITKLKARRVVKDAMKIRHTPSALEIEKVRRLPPGNMVLVYREGHGWTEYTLVRVRGNEVDVVLPSGKVSTFPVTVVRPFYQLTTEQHSNNVKPTKGIGKYNQMNDHSEREHHMVTRSQRNMKKAGNSLFAMIVTSNENELFRSSRTEEIKALVDAGCFEIAPAIEADGHRIYRSRFVDKVKPDGTMRSRLCVAACNDQSHGLFTASPTMKRISLRLFLTIAATEKLQMHVRDVTKAFIMSKTTLRRPIYMKAPKEMKLEKGKIVKVVRPVYGMPESPMHWFKTYIDYHKNTLSMSQSKLDPCLLYRSNEEGVNGIIGIQVDDTICAGTSSFLDEEKLRSKEFPSKGKETISSTAVRFNGVELQLSKNGIVMKQENYINEIDKGKFRLKLSFEQFRSIRAKYAYAAFSTAPIALIHVALLAQYTESRYGEDMEEALKLLNKCQEALYSNLSVDGLKYVYIPREQIEVVVCIDAAFAVNKDMSSQLGLLAMVRHKLNGDVNIIHFASGKSKRVCKSVLAAELFALVDGFDVGYSIAHSLQEIYGRQIDLTLYTDSQSLYGLCISLAHTTERRLQIDLSMIREAYERRDITNIVWIEGKNNPADDLTKITRRAGVLSEVIATNRFFPEPRSWIQRDAMEVCTTGQPVLTN